MNAKDTILQQLTPLVAMPSFEPLAPDPRVAGHRFIAGHDGLWIDVENPWLSARQRIADSASQLPFGEITPHIRLKCGALPKTLLEEFVADAKRACPNETAAIMTWDPETGDFELVRVALQSSSAHVHYERPRLSPGQYLVGDLHSHGHYPAGFSAQDDLDDDGSLKVAIVVGRCDTLTPEVEVRLCLYGHYVPLHHKGRANKEMPHEA